MVYSFVTYSKVPLGFIMVFNNDLEDNKYLKLLFVPHKFENNPFSKDKIDIHSIKMRDVEVLINYISEYGLTKIIY